MFLSFSPFRSWLQETVCHVVRETTGIPREVLPYAPDPEKHKGGHRAAEDGVASSGESSEADRLFSLMFSSGTSGQLKGEGSLSLICVETLEVCFSVHVSVLGCEVSMGTTVDADADTPSS